MHLKGIRKDEKTYFLPYKVHDKTISLKIDVYFLGDALKSTHLYKGEKQKPEIMDSVISQKRSKYRSGYLVV